jgi:hypothetical protein
MSRSYIRGSRPFRRFCCNFAGDLNAKFDDFTNRDGLFDHVAGHLDS